MSDDEGSSIISHYIDTSLAAVGIRVTFIDKVFLSFDYSSIYSENVPPLRNLKYSKWPP